MEQSEKLFHANFYKGLKGLNDDGTEFALLMLELEAEGEWLSRAQNWGIKIIESDNGMLFGELKQYRADAPHIGKPAGDEKEIEMDEDEHVIEKAFFLYSLEHKILLLQQTAYVRSPNSLSSIINDQNKGSTVLFHSLVNEDGIERIVRQESFCKTVKCSVALPIARMLSPADDWSQNVLALAEGATGSMHFEIKADMRGTEKHPLERSIIHKVISGARSGFLKSAKVTPVDGDSVDLLDDRLSATITPTMSGRYPIVGSIRDELVRAFQDNASILDEYNP